MGYLWGNEKGGQHRPCRYNTIFRLSISFCLVFGKTWLYKSIVIARLLCPRMVFKVCGLPHCSMYRVAKVSLKACAVKCSIGLPCSSSLESALLIALFLPLLCQYALYCIIQWNILFPDSLFGVPVVLVLSSLNVTVFVTRITFCL